MIRQSLREMVKMHEGCSLFAYHCPAGFWTIGYGWNIEAHPLPEHIAAELRAHSRITEEMAEELLTISLEAALLNAEAIFPGFQDFSDDRQDALTDFVFNVGTGTAMKFKRLRQAIAENNWSWAADELESSKWFKQVGNRGRKIVEMVRHG